MRFDGRLPARDHEEVPQAEDGDGKAAREGEDPSEGEEDAGGICVPLSRFVSHVIEHLFVLDSPPSHRCRSRARSADNQVSQR